MILAWVASALAGLPAPGHLRDADPSRDVFHQLHARGALGPSPPSNPAASMPWDVQSYLAHVRIDPDLLQVTGTMTITAARRPDQPSGDLLFHYTGGELRQVTVDGVVVTPEDVDGAWHVAPGGDTATVVVEWTRTGRSVDWGLQFDDGITWSVDEPDYARTWLPVYDEPWDKATWTWEIEAPSGLVVAANGEQECWSPGTDQCVEPGVVEDDGRTFDTWKWVFSQPIATYLVVLHIADYQVFDVGDDIPVTIWAQSPLAGAVESAFGNTPDMLSFFSERYGAYPFARYGNAIVPFGGAMENTTCTSFGDVYVGENAELVNVHELGHHWFGDDVTLADWRDVWLNEGFASYTEALWYEAAYGQEGLTEYVDWQRDTYYQWKYSEGDFPVYDPDNLFGGTVYDKGSWILHMLRGMVGDDAFFHALSDYTTRYAYANASTSEFEESFEASTLTDLSWFFDGYVYGTGEPSLAFGYRAVDGGVVVAIESDTTMPLPVPLRITLDDGSELDTKVTLSASSVCVVVPTSGAVSDVELDPDLWLLTYDRTTLAQNALDSCVTSLEPAPPDTGTPPREGGYHGGSGCGCGTGTPGTLGALGALGAALGLARRRR